jgi:hypothetical protein
MVNHRYFEVTNRGIGVDHMKRHGAKKSQRSQDGKEPEGEPEARSAILHSVAIVSDKRFRLDIELRHPR